MEYDYEVYYMRSIRSVTTQTGKNHYQRFIESQNKQVQKTRLPKPILIPSGRSPSVERRKSIFSVKFAESEENANDAPNRKPTTMSSANRFVDQFYQSVKITPPPPAIPPEPSLSDIVEMSLGEAKDASL